MEASSPLAAMQPPSLMPAWGGSMCGSRHLSSANGFGPGAFNFKDLSMKKSSSDYFAMKPPIRGSSPTTSLAADLSQNMHIDMSPQLPTPRRSLFTSNLFGTIDGRDFMTTPPLPSSSPGSMNDVMDMSPLPHKTSFYQQGFQSPTPRSNLGCGEVDMESSPLRSELDAPKPERRKTLLRPASSRAKGYPFARAPEPPFRFGAGASKLSTSTSMSLGECFMESPPQERRPQSAHSPVAPLMAPPKLKQAFSTMGGTACRNGSPIGNHLRKSSNPLIRPRKQFRRALSMFENPEDFVKGKRDDCPPSNLQSVMDIDEIPQPILPHFFLEGQPDSIPRICRDTFVDVLDGKYKDQYDRHVVIDCRFEYEYQGGHIDGAVNFNDKDELASHLFEEEKFAGKTLLIFHCEYSAHRAPIVAGHVRKQDRAYNADHYPRLTFPDVYILDGGYSAFFSEHRERCFPQNYVEMDSKEHVNTCEREMNKFRHHRKLSRAQTFAFGQHLDDSPTAPARGKSGAMGMMTMEDMADSPIPAHDKGTMRRMVSY
ncbi:hypothetical protein F5884DRAFT_154325 [Xylogone sp. PMI_703]|nr:hypothetical protein F5884DRAFT_154325 [Xylogone sp. PMI_703]